MKEKLKVDSGITLVALVVTIVIMLILAGVSLNFILGDYGLFSKSKEGADKYSKQQVNEQQMLDDIDTWIDENLGSGNKDTLVKVEVGVITDKKGTIDGNAGTPSNPTVPAGYMPVNTDTAQWMQKMVLNIIMG